MSAALELSQESLRATVRIRHGDVSQAGWAVRLRDRFGYFNPDVYYETAVHQLLSDGASWIEIGGGSAIFPSNNNLSVLLSQRCCHLVGVDPSDNIHSNPYLHERVQSYLEDYRPGERFDFATARMVVEHVQKPQVFVSSLARLLNSGGIVVLLTVNKWAPITAFSRLTPFWFHVKLKRILWQTEDKDTFPTVYKMNTRADLRRLMGNAGFEELAFFRLDDCRTLARWKPTHWLELTLWRALRILRLGYPEQCLLGVYRRNEQ